MVANSDASDDKAVAPATAVQKQHQEVQRVLDEVTREVYTRKGRRDESAALDHEERRQKRAIVQRNSEFFQTPFVSTEGGHAFTLCGYVDGTCEDHVVEVKNRMKRLFTTIPLYEKVQMHAYMVLARRDRCLWVQRYHGEQESRMVEFDGDWWESEVWPSVCRAVDRYHVLRTTPAMQRDLLTQIEGTWAPSLRSF